MRERLVWPALEYPIPPSANRLLYMLGGITFSGILLLAATGAFLDQFYDPTSLGAHSSVVFITTRLVLGSWVRGLHYWAATVVVVSSFAHLVWVFRRRSYTRPRELQWWSGVLLLALLFALVFTGTVLRGDQEGGEALAHAVAGAALVGAPGAPLDPDFAPSTTLIARMHAAHVSLLPLLLVGLVTLHFWLIRHHGIHASEPKTKRFTDHLKRLSGLSFLLVAAIGVLAALAPPGLGYPAVSGVEVTKPFWPFLWIYGAENTIGLWGMLAAPGILFGSLFLAPLIDRGERRKWWVVALGAATLAALIAALLYGALAATVAHIGM